MLSDLSVGDELYCCGAYYKTKTKKYNYSNGKQDGIGKKYESRIGFPDGENNPGYVNGGFTKFNNFKIKTENVCFDCGVKTPQSHLSLLSSRIVKDSTCN